MLHERRGYRGRILVVLIAWEEAHCRWPSTEGRT